MSFECPGADVPNTDVSLKGIFKLLFYENVSSIVVIYCLYFASNSISMRTIEVLLLITALVQSAHVHKSSIL